MEKKEYGIKLSLKLLSFLLEVFDEVEVVERLIEYGFNYDELNELGFNNKVIKKAQNEIDKGLIQ
jgi:hypothetical protein